MLLLSSLNINVTFGQVFIQSVLSNSQQNHLDSLVLFIVYHSLPSQKSQGSQLSAALLWTHGIIFMFYMKSSGTGKQLILAKEFHEVVTFISSRKEGVYILKLVTQGYKFNNMNRL